MRVRAWWSRTGPVKRVVVAVLAAVIGLNAGLALVDALIGSDPGGTGGSSFATQEQGVAAWADLLRVRDVPVRSLRVPLDQARLEPGATLVIVDPGEAPTESELRALLGFVGRGGRVVAVGRGAVPHMTVALGHDPRWQPGGPTAPSPRRGESSLGPVRELAADGRGQFRSVGPLEVIAGGRGAVTAVRRGQVTAVADPSIFWNDHLARADNAAFALALSGDGPVLFAEEGHGYGAAKGLAALPERWRWCGAGLLVTTLLAMWCVGQRVGPPERAERDLPPPRVAYVGAMVGALDHAAPRDPLADPTLDPPRSAP